MPSRAKVLKTRVKEDEIIVTVKVRGVGTKDFSNPVAKRAKLKAAREVGIVADYIPEGITVEPGENINKMLEGMWLGEIEEVREVDNGVLDIQQTVIYGVRFKR